MLHHALQKHMLQGRISQCEIMQRVAAGQEGGKSGAAEAHAAATRKKSRPDVGPGCQASRTGPFSPAEEHRLDILGVAARHALPCVVTSAARLEFLQNKNLLQLTG